MISADAVVFSVSEQRLPHIRIYFGCEVDGKVFKYEALGVSLTKDTEFGFTDVGLNLLSRYLFEVMRRLDVPVDWPDVLWRYFRSSGFPASQNVQLIAHVLQEIRQAAYKLATHQEGDPEYGVMLFHRMMADGTIELYDPIRLQINKVGPNSVVMRKEVASKARSVARALLDSIADKGQHQDYYKVISGTWSDVEYRVYDDPNTWIDVYYKGEFSVGLCLIVSSGYLRERRGNSWAWNEVVHEDALLQKILVLRHDEEAAWQIANYDPVSRHCIDLKSRYTAKYNRKTKELTFELIVDDERRKTLYSIPSPQVEDARRRLAERQAEHRQSRRLGGMYESIEGWDGTPEER